MATLDNSSGKYQGTKRPKHINTRAKAAMMMQVTEAAFREYASLNEQAIDL